MVSMSVFVSPEDDRFQKDYRIVGKWACDSEFHKDNQMKSPSLLSGPKIRKAYFETSNPKMLQILMGVYKVK